MQQSFRSSMSNMDKCRVLDLVIPRLFEEASLLKVESNNYKKNAVSINNSKLEIFNRISELHVNMKVEETSLLEINYCIDKEHNCISNWEQDSNISKIIKTKYYSSYKRRITKLVKEVMRIKYDMEFNKKKLQRLQSWYKRIDAQYNRELQNSAISAKDSISYHNAQVIFKNYISP
jgi:hypothetical protein